MRDRYWSYDLDGGMQWHDTAEEAERAADDRLTICRDEARADGEWPSDVESICWGSVLGHIVETTGTTEEYGEEREWVDYHLADMPGARALTDVAGERERQDAKWGALRDHPDASSDLRRLIVPSEVARDACDTAFVVGRGTWAHILVEEVAEAIDAASDPAALRAELVQVAAVAAAWIEAIDRREAPRVG